MIRLNALASGSTGNAFLVRNNNTSILIDAGLTSKQLNLRLGKVGVNIEDLDGIVLTHTHKDHLNTGALKAWESEVPLYIQRNDLVWEKVRRGFHDDGAYAKVLHKNHYLKTFRVHEKFSIGGLDLMAFSVPHDQTTPCVGFNVYEGRSCRMSLASDFGVPDRLTQDRLVQTMLRSELLVIEADYDQGMLRGSPLPESVVQRISENHLSNYGAADIATSIIRAGSYNLKRVVLAHLSNERNRPELAREIVQQALRRTGSDAKVAITHRREEKRLTPEEFRV